MGLLPQDDKVLLPKEERKHILVTIQREVPSLLRNGVKDFIEPPPLTASSETALALRFLMNPEETTHLLFEENRVSYGHKAAIEEYRHRARKKMFDDAMRDASPELLRSLAIATALDKADGEGYKKLRVSFLLKRNLDKKVSVDAKISLPLAHYDLEDGLVSAALNDFLASDGDAATPDLAPFIAPGDIEKISCGRKILYEKNSQENAPNSLG